MGFFDKIKKKVKAVYNKADTAVGGYLPGGQTPQQVSQPAPQVAPSAPTKTTPADVLRGIEQPVAPPAPSPTTQKVISGVSKGLSEKASAPRPSVAQQSTSSQNYQAPQNQSVQQPLAEPEQQPVIEPDQVNGAVHINPATGLEYTGEEAPYGLTDDGQGGARPVTLDESGLVSEIDAGDIMMITGVGGLVKSAAKGLFKLGVKGLTKLTSKEAASITTKSLKHTRQATKVMKEADRIGAKIEKAGGPYKPGDLLPSGKMANEATAKLYNDIIMKTVTKVSPWNYKTILGMLSLGTVFSGAVWSGFGSRNVHEDTNREVNYMIQDAIEDGNWEMEEKLEESLVEFNEWYEETKLLGKDTFSTPWRVGIAIDKEIKLIAEGRKLKKEAKKEAEDVQNVNSQLGKDLSTQAEGMTPEEIAGDPDIKEFASNPENWMYNIVDTWKDAVKQVGYDKSNLEEEVVDTATDAVVKKGKDYERKEDLRVSTLMMDMSDEQIMSDPYIMEMVSDSKYDFSTVTKLRKEAAGRLMGGRGIDRGETVGPATPGVTEAPSSLNFGLLNTSGISEPAIPGKMIPGEKQPDIEPGIRPQPEQTQETSQPQTETGNPVNTWEQATGIYTDNQGRGSSVGTPPPGARII